MNKVNVKSFSKWAFFAGLFLLPLVFWPQAYIPYEIPKVWFFQRWVEILGVLGVLGILRGKREQEDKRRSNALVYLVFIFVLVGIISSLLGVNFSKSLVGNYYRMDGLLTLLHLATLFFFLVLFWEEEWKKGTALAITTGSLMVSFWTILSGALGQFGPTFGNPNFLSGYLLVSLPFTVLVAERARRIRWTRGIRWTGVLAQVLAIGLTGSAAGILGVLLLGTGYFWGRLNKLKILKLLVFLSLLSYLGYLSYLRTEAGRAQFFPESRQRIIIRGFNGFLKRPILGWGVANFDYAFESNFWPIKFNNDVYVDKAHGNLLEVLVTEGVVGFGVYVWIIFLVFRRLLKDFKGDIRGEHRGDLKGRLDWKITLLFSFLLFLFHSQTNIISINEEMIFWLIAGISVRQNRLSIEAESDKIDRHEINKADSE